MKAPRLRLMSTPRRATHATCRSTIRARRALALTWKREVARAIPPVVARGPQSLHQHFNTLVHVHLRTVSPIAVRAVTSAAATARDAGACARSFPRPMQHLESRVLETRLSTIRQDREHTHLRTVGGASAAPRSAPSEAVALRLRRPVRALMVTQTIETSAAPGVSPSSRAPRRIAARTPVPRTHYLAPVAPRAPRPEPAGAARATALRSLALVWHKSAAPPADQTSSEIIRSAGSMRSAAQASPAMHGHAGVLPAAQIQQLARDTQRALLLDASLADRLADDVLKRVDKRLRIERERRGL